MESKRIPPEWHRRQLPIQNEIEPKHHNNIAGICFDRERTLQAKTVLQRQIEATDRQIDQLVYELYDLTEEEIKIVEESLKWAPLTPQP